LRYRGDKDDPRLRRAFTSEENDPGDFLLKIIRGDMVRAVSRDTVIWAKPDGEEADVRKVLSGALLPRGEDLLENDSVPARVVSKVASVDNIKLAGVNLADGHIHVYELHQRNAGLTSESCSEAILCKRKFGQRVPKKPYLI
jgi:hypothetical protein